MASRESKNRPGTTAAALARSMGVPRRERVGRVRAGGTPQVTPFLPPLLSTDKPLPVI